MDTFIDKLLPAEIQKCLRTSLIGREIVYFEETDSTNNIAKNLANKGAGEGTLIIAEEQHKGRGRLNRTWVSAPYKNILISLIFRPCLQHDRAFYLTMITSIAIVKAVQKTTGLSTLIKWPNDVYLNNKKLAGILTELNLDQSKINYAIVGIGLNVNIDTSLFEEIKDTSTSLLMESGEAVSRTELLCSILEWIEAEYELLKQNKYDHIRNEWKKHSLIIGKEVIVFSGDHTEQGIAESIAEDGSLILKKKDGEKKNISAGDVSLRLKQ